MPPESEYRDITTQRDYVERIDGHAQVYTGDHYHYHAPTYDPVASPQTPRVLHNLPQADYGQFVGRAAELAQLRALLAPRSRHFVITIDGIGGIGKSALALEIARQYLHQYEQLPPAERFDAIVWTSAKQTVLTANGIRSRRRVLHSLNDIYTAIAAALQREDITRASAAEQDALVSIALARQRALLIVDNLETVDDEAVLDFLRELPDPTKAIVTTRHKIDAAYPVRLTGMPLADAQHLIAQECAKKNVSLSEELQRRLFERTGGVPLAIVWSIAQMGFGYSSEAVLQRLGQPTGDIAQFCFAGAVERIKDKPAYRLLLTLSLCADSAGREALGYAAELPELDRDDGLVELEKLSLVNKLGDRFWLLPLTKEFVAAEFDASAHKEPLERKWVEYFCRLTENYGSKDWNWKNYDWLLDEGENILAIVHRAINAVDQGHIALTFVQALQRYLNIQGRRTEMKNYGETLRRIAEALNDQQTWAWICVHWLFWLYGSQNNFAEAEKLIRQGLALYQHIGDIKGTCFAMTYLARLLRRTDRQQDAEATCRQALALAQTHHYGDGIAAVNFELGKISRDRKEWNASKTYFEKVLNWYNDDAANLDIQSKMSAIGNLGFVEFHIGNYQKGKELLEQSLAFIEQTGGKGHTAILHLRLAHVERKLGNSQKARAHLQETLFWAERLNLTRELEAAQALLSELQKESDQSATSPAAPASITDKTL